MCSSLSTDLQICLKFLDRNPGTDSVTKTFFSNRYFFWFQGKVPSTGSTLKPFSGQFSSFVSIGTGTIYFWARTLYGSAIISRAPSSNITHLTTRVTISSFFSSVGIALGYGLDDRGSRVRFPAGARNFSLHHRVQNGSGAHTASFPLGTRSFFPSVKRPKREADTRIHLVPRSRMRGAIPPLPQYVFMA
jgi:hypothetical protein